MKENLKSKALKRYPTLKIQTHQKIGIASNPKRGKIWSFVFV